MITNRMRTEPIPVVRQHRPVRVRDFTTAKPGKINPVAAFGLLRGDSCSGRLNVAIEMNETYEILFNRMHARVNVWFVPALAFERFQRNKTFFERSAMGEPKTNDVGAATIPFIETHAFAVPATPFYKALGIAYKNGTAISTAYREAYNKAVSFQYRQRSKSLTPRADDDMTLATAMWGPNSLSEIVPDFDAEMIAGSTPLTVVGGNLPVYYDPSGVNVVGVKNSVTEHNSAIYSDATGTGGFGRASTAQAAQAALYAKLSPDGVTVALANFDQARKLVEWAKVREQFEGHEEPWIIETLMSGIEIDDQQWFQPMLIDTKMVDIKQLKRMATDGASLEEGVANGVATVSVGVNVPQNPYGGVVLVTVEPIPEQLYERQADPYLTTTDVNQLPRYDRDVLNPMPVVEVKNKEVDVNHAAPDGRFGYARRNWQWANMPTRVGGDLYAPNADAATAVERRSIYPTEVANPALNTEFYLATTLGRQVFVDEVKDPFKIGVGGVLDVIGLTVIGEVHESEANYDAVRAEYAPLQLPAGQ
ncbi:major capsid protein [Tortoise microvirus 72]|nr:major capsid protein [Tortoise microvirus 72]